MNEPQRAWLPFGLNPHGELISIEEVARGKTDLRCPYCETAKKGAMKVPHFAHTGPTCKPLKRKVLPTLPLYDRFTLSLKPVELKALQTLWETYGVNGWAAPLEPMAHRLCHLGFLPENPFRKRDVYECRSPGERTHQGKIPFGARSLRIFADLHEARLLEELKKWEGLAKDTRSTQQAIAQADLRLYQAQLRRVLAATRYFLQVEINGQRLHKIGITTREVEERALEIIGQLRTLDFAVSVELLGTWAHRGHVALYFQHRYARWQHTLATLTKYFACEDVRLVRRNLRKLKAKTLNEREQNLLRRA